MDGLSDTTTGLSVGTEQGLMIQSGIGSSSGLQGGADPSLGTEILARSTAYLVARSGAYIISR